MAKFEEIFEDIGRKLDAEVERLRQAAKTEISPATRQKTAHVLRRVSDALARYAKDIESEISSKTE